MADADYERPEHVDGQWADDVRVVTDNDVDTTGGHKVWTAARRLRDFLEAQTVPLCLDRPGLKVLELGAGCGWLGLTVARNLPNSTVLMTEQAKCGAVEHLWTNIEANKSLVGDRVSASKLDWTDCLEGPEQERQESSGDDRCPAYGTCDADGAEDLPPSVWDTQWDLIIGSDLVYNHVGVEVLPQVLKRLLSSTQKPELFYGHSLGRFQLMDIDFLDNIKASGLVATRAADHDDLTACQSDHVGLQQEHQQRASSSGDSGEKHSDYSDGEEPLMDLFPELQPTVFYIRSAIQ